MSKKFFISCATLGFVGYVPAPGTCATVVALLSCYGMQQMGIFMTFPALMFVTVLAFYIVHSALLSWYGSCDPKEFVLDEVIGYLWALGAVPLTIKTASISFILFRVLDIYKPSIIGFVEKFSGCWGIMADDILAGIITHICLILLCF